MIVTRQRPKKREYHRVFLPLAAIVLLIAALVLPPSRNFIFNGPLSPVFRVLGAAFDNIAKPFHFAALNNEIGKRDEVIKKLQSQLAAEKDQIAARDRQISSLQAQVNQVVAQAAADRSKDQKPLRDSARPAVGSATVTTGDLAANATPDMRRTATYWASMDAENAAKLVQRLPTNYVARVLALMSADSAGQILNALPAGYAATLTQEHPELRQ